MLQELRKSVRRQALMTSLLALGLLALPLVPLATRWEGMDLTDDWEVDAYAQDALGGVEPGALILVESDAYTFTLWYYHYVEELRPDVLVINYPMLSFEWYRHTVEVHHPEVLVSGPDAKRMTKLDMVLRNLDQRAVYIAEDADDLPGMQLTPVGRLWQVTTP